VCDEAVVLERRDTLLGEDGLLAADGTGDGQGLVGDVAAQAMLAERVKARQHLGAQSYDSQYFACRLFAFAILALYTLAIPGNTKLRQLVLHVNLVLIADSRLNTKDCLLARDNQFWLSGKQNSMPTCPTDNQIFCFFVNI
jgi:hypothetical protein